ncbi:MAG: TIGR02594 family protein [Bacteroidota bacterium]
MKRHIQIALSQYGVKEITGTQDNPEVLKYFDETGFDGKRLKDETAWCSAFTNWVCKKAGLPFTGKLNARSWLDVGREVETPEIGDLVVLWRESRESWKGHVGFYINNNDQWIRILGGNQNNQVKISAYRSYRLLKYIRLT